MICSILASTGQGGIGNKGTLPWPKHKEDLAWFKKHTTGHIVAMGRKTWDDPMMPKPLPNRVNCIFSTRDLGNFSARRLYGDPSEEIKALQSQFPNRNVFVIGGQSLYDSTESVVERIFLTRMKENWWADTRINLDRYLTCFQLKSVTPGEKATYEIWDRVIF